MSTVAGVRAHAGRRHAALRRLRAAECRAGQRRAGVPCAVGLGPGWLLVAGGLRSRRRALARARFRHLHQHAGLLLRIHGTRLGRSGNRQGLRPGFSPHLDPRQRPRAGTAARLARHPPAAPGHGRLHRRHAGAGVGHSLSRPRRARRSSSGSRRSPPWDWLSTIFSARPSSTIRNGKAATTCPRSRRARDSRWPARSP